MKKFTFPLGRVMEFRRMEARIEEAKLEVLYAGLRGIETREATLIERRAQAEKALKAQPSVSGDELQEIDRYTLAMNEELKRMDKTRIECRKRIDVQFAVLTAKRREVKLLGKLKEQRFEQWEKQMSKEIDDQADEAYLAKWKGPNG